MDILVKLQGVVNKVTGIGLSRVNFGMSVPANPNDDLDLIASEAMRIIEELREQLKESQEQKQDMFDTLHCIIDGAGHENEFAVKWRNEEIDILEAVQGYVDSFKSQLSQSDANYKQLKGRYDRLHLLYDVHCKGDL